ncbi:MAG TPA: GH3 auxin-responsive promoter family protein [Bacteroidia bacterium]
MPILNSIASWWMRKRMHQIELFMKYPHDVQEEWFRKLIASAAETEWGTKYDYASIDSVKDFSERVPLQDYDSLKPFIERMRKGEENILWPSETTWFAKSSGTTNDKSKYIPVSMESLEGCHYNAGRDMVAIHCTNHPETKLFTGKNLSLAGSFVTDRHNEHESYSGDLSAIVISNLPMWAEFLRAPDLSIALLSEWEEKLEKIARATMAENMTSIAGVPSWMLVLLRKILDISGKKNIKEVWPDLEVFFHGGVNFTPYRELFRDAFGNANMNYLELYNASEGFFGIQDQKDSDELLLMLDYGIFYEFIPMEQTGSGNDHAIPLSEVEAGKNYAMVISTTAGLWRYKIGDTIRFTSTTPYRFRITGRTKHFINVFGEEVIIDNAENALRIACEKTGALVKEYTAGPVYMKGRESGAHEWLIEFEKEPQSLGYFTEMLDNALKSLNSDYEAKRYHNFTLKEPLVRSLKPGTFMQWLKVKGKLGGQNKVPRLSNDRKYIDEILSITA